LASFATVVLRQDSYELILYFKLNISFSFSEPLFQLQKILIAAKAPFNFKYVQIVYTLAKTSTIALGQQEL
jgi:hypothetical protein